MSLHMLGALDSDQAAIIQALQYGVSSEFQGLGARAPLVDCVERGRALARGEVIGDNDWNDGWDDAHAGRPMAKAWWGGDRSDEYKDGWYAGGGKAAHFKPVIGVDDTRPLDEYARTVEAEFQAMKAFADKVGWPADLAPQIGEIDKAWQVAKAAANAKMLSVVHDVPPEGGLRGRIKDMSMALQKRKLGDAAPPRLKDDGWLTQRTIFVSVPNYGVVAGGVGILATVAAILRKVMR